MAADRLAPYKRPKTYFRVDDLPRTSTGKLRRRALPAVLGLEPPPARDRDLTRRPVAVPTGPTCHVAPWGKICPVPIATVNPATGKTEQTFDPLDDAARAGGSLARAAQAARSYRATTFAERARWAVTAAELLEGEIPDVARVMTTEMGKTFAAAKGEAAKCAKGLRWFAEHAEAFLADERVESDARDSRVIYRPMGPVLAVMPWNFPLWQVMRFAAPALMAGNVGLSSTPRTSPRRRC